MNRFIYIKRNTTQSPFRIEVILSDDYFYTIIEKDFYFFFLENYWKTGGRLTFVCQSYDEKKWLKVLFEKHEVYAPICVLEFFCDAFDIISENKTLSETKEQWLKLCNGAYKEFKLYQYAEV